MSRSWIFGKFYVLIRLFSVEYFFMEIKGKYYKHLFFEFLTTAFTEYLSHPLKSFIVNRKCLFKHYSIFCWMEIFGYQILYFKPKRCDCFFFWIFDSFFEKSWQSFIVFQKVLLRISEAKKPHPSHSLINYYLYIKIFRYSAILCIKTDDVLRKMLLSFYSCILMAIQNHLIKCMLIIISTDQIID